MVADLQGLENKELLTEHQLNETNQQTPLVRKLTSSSVFVVSRYLHPLTSWWNCRVKIMNSCWWTVEFGDILTCSGGQRSDLKTSATDLLLTESVRLLEVEGFGRVWYHSLEHVVSVNHDPEQRRTVCILLLSPNSVSWDVHATQYCREKHSDRLKWTNQRWRGKTQQNKKSQI